MRVSGRHTVATGRAMLALLLLAGASCGGERGTDSGPYVEISGQRVGIEIADTREAQRRGLSGRKRLAWPQIHQIQCLVKLDADQPVVDPETHNMRLNSSMVRFHPQPFRGIKHRNQVSSHEDDSLYELRALGNRLNR